MTFRRRSTRSLKEILGIGYPHWTSVIIWILGILAMLGLTVKYMYPIVRDYVDEAANQNIEISIAKNGTVHPPPLFLCMPLNGQVFFKKILYSVKGRSKNGSLAGPCPECDALANHSWNVWKGANQNFTKATALQNLFLDKLFSDSIGNALSKNNSDWNKPVLDSAFSVFQAINTIDRGFFEKSAPQGVMPDYVLRYPSDRLEFVFENLVRFICESIQISFYNGVDEVEQIQENDFCVDHIIKTAGVKSNDQFCFQLPTKEKISLFTVKEEYFEYCDERNDFFVYPENPLFSNPPALYATPELQTPTRQEGATIKYNMQSKVMENRENILQRCYKERLKSDCVIVCKRNLTSEECSCAPFTTRLLHKNETFSEYCTQQDYQNCSDVTFNRFGECVRTCESACVYETYQWQLSTSLQNASLPWFKLWVQPFINLPYLEFTVKYKDDVEDFISAVGGLFNFYLGLSGLSIIAFFLYVLDSGRRWRQLKRENQNRERISGAMLPVLWHWHWLSMATSSEFPEKNEGRSESMNATVAAMQEKINGLTEHVTGLEKRVEKLKTKGKLQKKRYRSLESRKHGDKTDSD